MPEKPDLLHQSPKPQVHVPPVTDTPSHGAIDAAYGQLGPMFLGQPTAPERATADGKGAFRAYQKGDIYWSPATGAHWVLGAILAKWIALGAEQGLLGYPLTNELATFDGQGATNNFEHGSIYWSPSTNAFEVHGPILTCLNALGGIAVFGYPLADVAPAGDNVGQQSTFQNGAIYSSDASRAYGMLDPIRAKWIQRGGLKGPGYPSTNPVTTSDKQGRYNDFQNSSIYWSPKTGAFEIAGDALTLWRFLDAERGALGYPVSDRSYDATAAHEIALAYHDEFQHGSIYVAPQTGAHAVSGPIRDRWLALGGAAGALGFPTTEIVRAYDHKSTYQRFEGGRLRLEGSTVTEEATIAPDFAIQALSCLGDDERSNLLALISKTVAGLRGVLTFAGIDVGPTLLRHPTALSQCTGMEGGGLWRTSTFASATGPWLATTPRIVPAVSPTAALGLDQIPALSCLFSTDSLNELAESLWLAVPHRWNEDNAPDPDGKIELKSFELTLAKPNIVKLALHGTWHGKPETDFTATYTDTISVDAGGHVTGDTAVSLDKDVSGFYALVSALNLAAPLVPIVGPMLAPFASFAMPSLYEYVDAVYLDMAGSKLPTLMGFGALASQVFPTSYPIAGKKQIDFVFDSVSVDPAQGMLASVSAQSLLKLIRDRVPEAVLYGVLHVTLYPGVTGPLTLGFFVRTSGMLAPLTYQWTAERTATVQKQDAAATEIVFDVSKVTVGHPEAFTVSIVVTDSEGLRASASFTTNVARTNSPVPTPRSPTKVLRRIS